MTSLCPSNSSLIEAWTSNRAQFNVFCNTTFVQANDLVSWSLSGTPQTDSLEDCLEICSKTHPLCDGVTWIPGQTQENCQLKSITVGRSFNTSNLVRGATVHSAKLQLSKFNETVADNTQYIRNGSTFDVRRDVDRWQSANFTSLHTDRIEPCMDMCATYDSCTGVIHDLHMLEGFNNCYLLNSTGVATGNTRWFSSAVRSLPSSNPNSNSSNKAWIAGVVIGVGALLAIIAGFLLWLRHRRRRQVLQLETPVSYTTSNHIMPEHMMYEVRGAGTGKSQARQSMIAVVSA